MSTIKLQLSPKDGKGFKVIATTQGEGEAEIEASLPFFTTENGKDKNWRSPLLRCLEMTAFNSQYFQEDEQTWMVASGILDSDRHKFNPNYLVNIGQRLFQALFPPDSNVKNALLVSLRSHEKENTQLHIQLNFSDNVVPRIRLADYPWELLHDGKGFLLLNRNVTISRYIAYGGVPPNLRLTDKVNVLLVSSTASDGELGLKKLGDSEVQAIGLGLEKARKDGRINFVQLEATRDKLRTYLTECRSEDAPQVLHFDGHGLYGKRCNNTQCHAINKGNRTLSCRKCNTILPEAQGYLVFEDGNGGADYVSAEELGALLSKSTLRDGNNKFAGIALVVLSACQSGITVEGESVFNGTAQNLIGQRIPSVVAMQYSVSVASAIKFAEQFYRSLGQRNSLGIAVSQAREAMGIEGNQWYRPVLYLRWQDNEEGQLFKDSPVEPSEINISQELLKLLNSKGEEKILSCAKEAYQACSPDDWPNAVPNNLEGILIQLKKMPQGESKYTSVEHFVGFLVKDFNMPNSIASPLDKWGVTNIKGYTELIKIIDAKKEQKNQLQYSNHYLIIEICESSIKDYYFVNAWLILDGDNYHYKNSLSSCKRLNPQPKESENKTLPLKEIPRQITDFLNSIEECASSKLTIEIFLPLKLLNKEVDQWEITDTLSEFLGSEYKVVVRSWERIPSNYNRKRGDWQEKWQILKKKSEEKKLVSSVLMSFNDDNFKNLEVTLKEQKNVIGVELKNPPLKGCEEKLFLVMLKTAIPVALWVRSNLSLSCYDQFNELRNCSIDQLIEVVKAQRLQASRTDKENHIGHHLSLLWEHPDRLPPYNQLL